MFRCTYVSLTVNKNIVSMFYQNIVADKIVKNDNSININKYMFKQYIML